MSSSRLVIVFASLLFGATTFGAIYALDHSGVEGSSILEFLLIPGLVVGTVLSGGGPHAGNGSIWFGCLVVVNVLVYSYLWSFVVRRLRFAKAGQS